SGPDASVNALHTQVCRELAEGKHYNGQVVDGPVADGECGNPPILDLGMLAAGKRALHRPELWDAKLLGELRIECHLRTPGIDEEGNLVAAVDAHLDHRQRIGLEEFDTRTCPVAMHLIGRLALEALQLRNIQ